MERRLTDQALQEIRDRAHAAGNGAMPARLAIAHYVNDVDRLAAEIERLQRDVLIQSVRALAAEVLIEDSPARSFG